MNINSTDEAVLSYIQYKFDLRFMNNTMNMSWALFS